MGVGRGNIVNVWRGFEGALLVSLATGQDEREEHLALRLFGRDLIKIVDHRLRTCHRSLAPFIMCCGLSDI